MVVDTSAVVASVAAEPDGVRFQETMMAATSVAMSSVSVLETRIVLHSRYGLEAVISFDEMLDGVGIVVVSFDGEMAQIAFDAFRRFGKGHHPAQLNIIDCAAYALAKIRNEPLLFKGDDFAKTDIESAL